MPQILIREILVNFKYMKIKKIFLITSLIVGFNSASIAGTYYLGAGAGQGDVNTNITVGTASLDEKGLGYKFYGGYHFNKYLSIEAFYNNYGKATLSGSNGQTFTHAGSDYEFSATADIDLDAWGMGITPIFGYEIPINEGNIKSIRPFVKAGIQYWEADLDLTSSSTNATLSLDDDWDYILGVGAFINFDFNGIPIGFRGEYETGNADDTLKILNKLDMFTASLFLSF